MNKKKILFRADGNTQIGLGHLYRLYAIYQILDKTYTSLFLSKNTDIVKSNFELVETCLIPSDLTIKGEPDWINSNFSKNEYILITDGYGFGSSYQKSIKSYGFILICIDDLANNYMYADLVINHSPYISEKDYSSELHTQFALGCQHALLRKLFVEAAKRHRVIDKMETVFVCFGGSDLNDITHKVIKVLLEIADIKKINVVLGESYLHTEINSLNNKKIFIHKNLSESQLLAVMYDSDFSISSASTISYELCCVKMPMIVGWYVENQTKLYKGLVEQGLVYGIGDILKIDKVKLKTKILEIIKINHKKIIRTQALLFDGKQSERLINKITALPFKIWIRPVVKDDVEQLFIWVNEIEVRKQSVISKPIEFEDHHKWLLSKIKSTESFLFIAIMGRIQVGQIRFDLVNGYFEIDYSIDRDYRGYGLGKEIIKRGVEELIILIDTPKIRAKVKKGNLASNSIFSKIGFNKLKTQDGSNFTSYALDTYNYCTYE